MLTILPVVQLLGVSNNNCSSVECEGIMKVQYQKISIAVGMEGFQLIELSDLVN